MAVIKSCDKCGNSGNHPDVEEIYSTTLTVNYPYEGSITQHVCDKCVQPVVDTYKEQFIVGATKRTESKSKKFKL